jgi:hypothetical protein
VVTDLQRTTNTMPRKSTIEKAREDAREGKAPSTQAGEFVHEEIEHVREGKHGVRNTKQAIAIGLSKARRAGVKLPPPKQGASRGTRRKAEQDVASGASRQGSKRKRRPPSPRRSRATTKALKREGRSAASRPALSRQAKQAATRKRRAARPRRGAAVGG